MTDASDPIELAEAFAEVARALMSPHTLDETLQAIVDTACVTVPGCRHAALSVIEKGKITTPVASGDVPRRVDAIQYETDQGPCLDAIRDRDVFVTDDLAAEDRWPDFARRAAEETHVHSMLSFRLFADRDTMGALNLYAEEIAAFDRDAQAVGAVFAAHGAVAMSNARGVHDLEKAMVARATIEQAKGIIMASTGVTPDEAFTILRQQSQSLNEKLRDVARGVVDQQRHHS